MKKIVIAVLIIILACCAVGCNPIDERIIAFGTVVGLKLDKGNPNKTLKTLEPYLSALDRDFDTDYEDGSLYKINNAKAGQEVVVSNEAYELLQLAKKLYKQTNGFFNIATFPLTELWKLSPLTYVSFKENYTPPTAQEIAEILPNCNFNDLTLKDNNVVIKSNEKIKVSFGALAKGYAGDKALSIARSNKNQGIIDMGGTIFTLGDGPFNVGIGNPRESNVDYFAKLTLSDGAIVCTSGDYHRYYIVGDKRYHHIFGTDGYPTQNGIISVTIVALNNKFSGALCDGLSTSVFALGLVNGTKLLNEYGIGAVIITADNKYSLVNLDESIFTLNDTGYKKYVQTT
ncbi:MAG: FAD:protein FMN transferase [Clostridia bacterium]